MHWFLDPIQKHYADFEGRIGRQEFWMFVLCGFGLNVVLSVVRLDFISSIVSLALLLPNIAMGARRLHDTGRSGWWQLLSFTIIGIIPLIIWLAEETTPTDNSHGSPAVPKVVPSAAAEAPVAPVVSHTATEVTAPKATETSEPLPEQQS